MCYHRRHAFEAFGIRGGGGLSIDPAAVLRRVRALRDDFVAGTLKATDGAFNYAVPEGTDISQFKSVVVWCKQFAVLFGTAPLN